MSLKKDYRWQAIPTPKTGLSNVYVDYYWLVDADFQIAFYGSGYLPAYLKDYA